MFSNENGRRPCASGEPRYASCLRELRRRLRTSPRPVLPAIEARLARELQRALRNRAARSMLRTCPTGSCMRAPPRETSARKSPSDRRCPLRALRGHALRSGPSIAVMMPFSMCSSARFALHVAREDGGKLREERRIERHVAPEKSRADDVCRDGRPRCRRARSRRRA